MVSGFTLLEMSIVLAVIALIAGGIIVGKDMIRASELQATVSQLQKYQAAVNTFIGKYNCLPGDCANANALGLGPNAYYDNATGNGAGNGIIDSHNLANQNYATENFLFWVHLNNSGLAELYKYQNPSFNLAASPTTDTVVNDIWVRHGFPAAKLGGDNWVWAHSDHHVNYVSIMIPTTSVWVCGLYWFCSGLTPQQAWQIDTKIDDGLPASGHVDTTTADATYDIPMTPVTSGAGGANANVCIDTSVTPNAYNMTNATGQLCFIHMMVECGRACH